MDDLNVLPPDKDIFHQAKKPISNKQKDHLIRAREKAKETIERRRLLEKQEQDKLDAPPPEEASEEEEEPVKPKKKSVKKPIETDEEKQTRKFETFMRNMNAYEQMKVQHQKDLEEAKKVKVSLNPDEYEHMLYLLEKDQKEKELAQASPVEPPKKEPPKNVEQVRRVVGNVGGRFARKTSRFGEG